VSKVFTVALHAEYTLTVDEVWPDGDAPENPTAEDVAKEMASYSNASTAYSRCRETLGDWGLDDVDVDVDGIEVVW
jgi:hypothetical protein